MEIIQTIRKIAFISAVTILAVNWYELQQSEKKQRLGLGDISGSNLSGAVEQFERGFGSEQTQRPELTLKQSYYWEKLSSKIKKSAKIQEIQYTQSNTRTKHYNFTFLILMGISIFCTAVTSVSAYRSQRRELKQTRKKSV